MRFAEVFLRLGCSLVGWMVLYAHALWLAVLHRVGCGPDGSEMHALLMWMVPMTIGMSFLPKLTRPFVEIQSILRWLAAPLAILVPFMVFNVWRVGADLYRTGMGICSDAPPAAWHYAWVPLQLFTIVVCAVAVLTIWLNSSGDRRASEATAKD